MNHKVMKHRLNMEGRKQHHKRAFDPATRDRKRSGGVQKTVDGESAGQSILHCQLGACSKQSNLQRAVDYQPKTRVTCKQEQTDSK